jgi:MFS family permease
MRRFLEPPLGLTVFVVGTCILGAEIAAARLLAPSFGASTIVWANTIGVVLVALSLGYWWGGRLADRNPTREGLFRLILVGALLMGAVPFVADPFLDVAVSALDSVEAGAFAGSLIAVLVLIATPVLVAGAVAPYALRLAMADVEHSGTVAGRLYAISTIGSLFGNFLAALLLIPLIGTRRTFLVFALAMAVLAVAGLARRRLVLVPAAIGLLIALPAGTVKDDTRAGARVVREAETEHRYLRVVERDGGSRTPELDEAR